MIQNDQYYLIEVKWSDDTPSKHFAFFANYFPHANKIQLVKELKREKTYPGNLEIRLVTTWLQNINLAK